MSIVVFPLVFLELLAIAAINNSFCNGSTFVGCIESERQALLRFKQDLKDPSNRLASWNGDGDCCSWAGVVCDKFTGHVLQLHLRNPHWKYRDYSGPSYIGKKLIDYEPWTDDQYDSYKRSLLIDKLELLDLRHNQFFGHLSNQLHQLKGLHTLRLSNNSISDPIPFSLGELWSLQELDISLNKLNGTQLSEAHFSNVTRLTHFDAFGTSLMFNVSSTWIPPFQLEMLGLHSCHLGPRNFWKSHSQLKVLDLYNNSIYGHIPNLTDNSPLTTLILSSNNFSGPLPLISSNLTTFDLADNAFSGSVFHFFYNFLSGELPNCWMKWPQLIALNLGYNNFSGSIPSSIGSLSFLSSLRLEKNNISGTIPVSLGNCTSLQVINLEENEFSGNIPAFIGERLSKLVILKLTSNKFQGILPVELCHLSSLQILDLANNNMFGKIPTCINNLTTMLQMDSHPRSNMFYVYNPLGRDTPIVGLVQEDAIVTLKGKLRQFITTLNLLRILNLSTNNFLGEIPIEVTRLGALQSLNLSHNLFIEKIPESIGAMRSLESFDLSKNQLSAISSF
ncbi:hypothetical protein ACOSQ2_026046 [Xanthoceras sorbifolium]